VNKKWFSIAAMVLALCSLTALPVSAQGPPEPESLWDNLGQAGSSQVEFCVPEAGYCQYYTYADNEDNHQTGSPDHDMGCTDAQCTTTNRTCRNHAKHPIEFRIGVSTITYDKDAILLLGARGAASLSQIARVEFNGTVWEVEDEDHPSDQNLLLWAGHVDPALIQPDGNLVQVYLRSGECVRLYHGWLLMTDWPFEFEAEEEFVPEPASVVLLGSGLVALAGYGTLRWRTRER
jgi:hypothetical protein